MSDGGDPQGLWLGLLKWSLAHSDGTSPSPETSMSDEDKSFLERALRETARNEPERMKEIMLELVAFVDATAASPAHGAANEERIERVLEELQDIVEQIDMAQVFCKFGGLQCLLAIAENGSGGLGFEVRSLASGVLATLSQNNMLVQDVFYSQGAVQRLAVLALSLLGSEASMTLAAKVMHALSCTIRNHPAAEEYFSLNHGKALLQAALPLVPPQSVLTSIANLASPNSYLPSTVMCMRRAVYLANALLASDTFKATRLDLLLPALLPAVFQCLSLEDLDLREGTCRLLLTLMSIPEGYDALTTPPHREAFLAALRKRESIVIADEEQEAHEKAIINQLVRLVEAGFASRNSDVDGSGTGSGTSTRTSRLEMRDADFGPDDEPRLLIGP